jgi:hypothetical protein
MAYLIKRQSQIDDRYVYFVGSQSWSDDRSLAVEFETENDAKMLFLNADGLNGGFKTAIAEEK